MDICCWFYTLVIYLDPIAITGVNNNLAVRTCKINSLQFFTDICDREKYLLIFERERDRDIDRRTKY